MEFVSRRQMARSADYQRPVMQKRSATILPSAFAAHGVRQQPVITVASSPIVQPQKVANESSNEESAKVVQSAQPSHSAIEKITYKESASEVASETSIISEVIKNNERAERVAATYVRQKPSVAEEKQTKHVAWRVLNVAVFTAAFAGMVAMGYDLFFVSHPKPSVSYQNSTAVHRS